MASARVSVLVGKARQQEPAKGQGEQEGSQHSIATGSRTGLTCTSPRRGRSTKPNRTPTLAANGVSRVEAPRAVKKMTPCLVAHPAPPEPDRKALRVE